MAIGDGDRAQPGHHRLRIVAKRPGSRDADGGRGGLYIGGPDLVEFTHQRFVAVASPLEAA